MGSKRGRARRHRWAHLEMEKNPVLTAGTASRRGTRLSSNRIRHYGFFANGQRRAQLATARALLNVSPVDEDTDHRDGDEHTPPFWLTCPACGQAMNVIECLPPTPRHRGGDPPRD